MKKLFCILLAICLTVSVTACTKSEGNTVDDTSVSASQTQDKNFFGLNEAATLKNLKITALKMEESKGSDYFAAEDGNIFVGINFEIENISDKSQSVSSILLFDAYADDIKCEYSLTANLAFGDGTLDGEIAPGKKLIGWYAVEVPQNWKQIELDFAADMFSAKKAKFVFTK